MYTKTNNFDYLSPLGFEYNLQEMTTFVDKKRKILVIIVDITKNGLNRAEAKKGNLTLHFALQKCSSS